MGQFGLPLVVCHRFTARSKPRVQNHSAQQPPLADIVSQQVKVLQFGFGAGRRSPKRADAGVQGECDQRDELFDNERTEGLTASGE